jgi:RNA polymerase sigma-70 factor, ECF subfamily
VVVTRWSQVEPPSLVAIGSDRSIPSVMSASIGLGRPMPTETMFVSRPAPDRGMPDDTADIDDQLMLALQGGDRRAYGKLYNRHYPGLLGFFCRRLRDFHLAEDLAQDTFIKLWEKFYDYLPRKSFRAWLYQIAYHLLIDKTRKRSHDLLLGAGLGSDLDMEDPLARIEGRDLSAADQATERELSAAVNEILATLPPDQMTTFILYVYVGLSLPEISEVMECPLATTKGRLRLARKKIVEELKKRGFPPPWKEEDIDREDSPQID